MVSQVASMLVQQTASPLGILIRTTVIFITVVVVMTGMIVGLFGMMVIVSSAFVSMIAFVVVWVSSLFMVSASNQCGDSKLAFATHLVVMVMVMVFMTIVVMMVMVF